MMESIAMYFDANQIKVVINKNEIIQSPDLAITILESIRFEEFEEKLNKRTQQNALKTLEFKSIKK